MNLAPLLAAPLAIKIHVAAAATVVALTPVQFWLTRKGSGTHRVAGYVWLGAMVVVALTSFLIVTKGAWHIGPFGPIHLLSVLALFSVWQAIVHARAHRISAHRKTLVGLSIGFWLAAAFTLAPGRIVGRMVFGG